MAENIELKLEQLTDAVRSLYSKPVMSNSELSNMVTNISQRFENTTETNSQKLVGVVIGETKKIIEEKQYELYQQLGEFENALKQISQDISNPKMSLEVSKILSEVSDIYAKLGNQEVSLQKINQSIVTSKSSNPINEVIKLSNEFAAFSRGFDGITHTLNKNFADFLNQIKSYSTKEEITDIQLELDTINGNVNSIISAIAIIDHKYKDLTGLIEAFGEKETIFSESMGQIRQLNDKFDLLSEEMAKKASKENIGEIKGCINQLSDNVKNLSSSANETYGQSIQRLKDTLNSIENKINQAPTTQDINETKGELKVLIDKLSLQSSGNRDELIGKIQENISLLRAQNDNGLKSQIFEYTNELNQGIHHINTQIAKIQDNIENSLSQGTQKMNDDVASLKEKLDMLAPNLNNMSQEAIISEINAINSQITKLQNNIENSLSQRTQKMNNDVASLKEKLDMLAQNMGKIPGENLLSQINTIEDNIRTITRDSLSSIATLITGEFSSLDKALENKEIKYSENLDFALNNLREDLKCYTQKITTLKDEVAAINQGNIKLLQEPIENALRDLSEVTIKQQLNNINQNVKDTTSSIFTSFERIKENFEHALSGTNIEILSQLKDTIPIISDKLEVLRSQITYVNNENAASLKQNLQESSETIKAYIEDINYRIKNEIKNSYNVPLSEIKIDLQNFSNYILDSIENTNSNIIKEFNSHKENIEGLLLELKNSNSENPKSNEELQNIKKDIIEGILGSTQNNKANFAIIEEKINKIIEEQLKPQPDNANEIVLEVINTVLEKIENNNQQQIHNAKELLEEIQTSNSQIVEKIEAEAKNDQSSLLSNEINLKLESIEEKLSYCPDKEEIQESISSIREHLDSLNSDLLDQLTDKLNEIAGENDEFSSEQNSQVNEYLSKIDEYLANVEYLKNNLSEDLKESIGTETKDLKEKLESAFNARNDEIRIETFNLIQKIANVETNIDKITNNISKITSSTDDTSYAYSLQDVESDIAKLRLSIEKNIKGDNYKEFINRLIELKNINLENNKLNHLIEGQMSHLNAWFKSATQKLEILSQKVENAEQMSMEEIKTRLIRSEKSPSGAKIDEVSERQISYLEELDEKLSLLLQKQNNEFDPTSFIDVTYQNMKQTKDLFSRMDELEIKIDKIQGYMEKIVAYIEE